MDYDEGKLKQTHNLIIIDLPCNPDYSAGACGIWSECYYEFSSKIHLHDHYSMSEVPLKTMPKESHT